MWDEQSRRGQQDASTAVQPTQRTQTRLIDSIATHATARVFALAAISGRQTVHRGGASRASPESRTCGSGEESNSQQAARRSAARSKTPSPELASLFPPGAFFLQHHSSVIFIISTHSLYLLFASGRHTDPESPSCSLLTPLTRTAAQSPPRARRGCHNDPSQRPRWPTQQQ